MTQAATNQAVTRLYTLHALTPLHAGTGQGVGDIDLPIARERATNLPFVPGSSVRGVLRDSLRGQEEQKMIFGPESANASEFAGAIGITDARLLLFPIASVAGTWAWLTSPTLLTRLNRDLEATGTATGLPLPHLPEGKVLVTSKTLLKVGKSSNVVLDDWQLSAEIGADECAEKLGKLLGGERAQMLEGHLCIVSDTVLTLAAELATEISARIRLNSETKTVERGALWYEESLPAETVLFGLVRAEQTRRGNLSAEQVLEKIGRERYTQFGGKAGTGRGLCQWQQLAGEASR